MIRRSEIRAAAAICAALVGAGFASGREVETFFARLGRGSWLGVAAACSGLGFLSYAVMSLARRVRGANFPDLYGGLINGRCRTAMHLVHGLLTLITAAAMIAAGGELGALALDLPNARLIGAASVLLAGVGLAAAGIPALGRLGLAAAALIAGVYAALALTQNGRAAFSREGLAAAAPMGLLYAAFNGALAGGVMTAAAREDARPARTGALVALIMLSMLLPANAALLRCDARLRWAALPAVVMTARWGTTGYYTAIALILLAVLTTLGAMLSSLRDQAAALRLKRAPALAICAALAALASVCGFETLVNKVYPVLGWICAFALLSLLLRWPDDSAK